MLVFRSLAVGLLGACFLLLVTRPTNPVRVERELVPVLQAPPPAATIIDVAPGMDAGEIVKLVRLGPGEHVVAFDDQPVTDDLDAGSIMRAAEARTGRYLDLTVRGSRAERRVLVLLH